MQNVPRSHLDPRSNVLLSIFSLSVRLRVPGISLRYPRRAALLPVLFRLPFGASASVSSPRSTGKAETQLQKIRSRLNPAALRLSARARATGTESPRRSPLVQSPCVRFPPEAACGNGASYDGPAI